MYATIKSYASDPFLRPILTICWPIGIVLGIFRFTLFFEMRGPTISVDGEGVQTPAFSTAIQEILEALSMSDLWVSLMFIHELLLGIFIVQGVYMGGLALVALIVRAEKPKFAPAVITLVAVAAMSFAAQFGAELYLSHALGK